MRFGVSPGRGGYTRTRMPAVGNAAGCLVLCGVLVALGLLVAVARGIAAVLATPYPWIAVGAGALIYVGIWFGKRLRVERSAKRCLDAIAELAGVAGARAGALEGLAQDPGDQADAFIVLAAWYASAGRYAEGIAAVDSAIAQVPNMGGLVGAIPLRFPGLAEPISFGAFPAAQANLLLVGGHLRTLAGRAVEATQALEHRLHEPHYGAALTALVDAHVQCGNLPRATALLQNGLGSVQDPETFRALRYRLATLLEAAGATVAAAAELRAVLAHGPYADAQERLGRIEAELAAASARASAQEEERRLQLAAATARAVAQEEERRVQLAAANARAIEQEDERRFQLALLEIRAARGPKSRENALEAARAGLQLPYMRERLLLEASRIEVQAVLEKVAGLKTQSARIRNLEEALYRLRSDEVPDEYQAEQITTLERALHEAEVR